MILPSQLTEQAGFVDGVVVELIWEFSPPEYVVWPVNLGTPAHLLSARPLTGPMSIWIHAPAWADWVVVRPSGDFHWFQGDASHLENGTKRPFWTKEQL